MQKNIIKRKTKQKIAIIDFLSSRKDHPTAEVVYTELKKSMPNISLGTVYRNLNDMAGSGEILKLKFDDGIDHYDAMIKPHYHFLCRECGAVEDIFDVKGSLKVSSDGYDGDVIGHMTYFYGYCPKCKKVSNA